MKKVLLIAFHYPPLQISSGLQRTLKFSQYLSDFSWLPSVLTISPRAHNSPKYSQMIDVPKEVMVKRAMGFDTKKHLSIAGKYPAILAYPDANISWWPAAVISGLKMIKSNNIDIVFSTYPIATSHLIGLALHKLTGKPWVADFRDPMVEKNYPTDPKKRKIYKWIERVTIKNCSKAVFTTKGALNSYAKKYPEYSTDKWAVIENAFDEENFGQAMVDNHKKKDGNGHIKLLHSGVIYPSERDPTAFFEAISELKKSGLIDSSKLSIVLRAAGHRDVFDPMLADREINDIVTLAPNIPYVEALKEMLMSDGLMVLQASNSNHQIPAKIYEYLRAEKPIFALTDEAGDTAGVLKQANVGTIVALDDKEKIKKALMEFIDDIKTGQARKADEATWSKHTRYARTAQLASLLDDVVN